MLSIGAMSAGQSDYYQKLAREDYYLEGGEPPGSWFGDGAQRLGLSGQVVNEQLSALFDGFSISGEALVQNAGGVNRQPGWDLTFSAPKSVSFLWSQLEGTKQQEVLAAHRAAVLAALSYLQGFCAFSRMGKGGLERVSVGLAVAVFEHSCSRAMDMQIHSHALVMNLGVDEGGKARSILSKPLYQAKMLAGAHYRCELACQLRERLGVELERPAIRRGKGRFTEVKKSTWFEIGGIDKQILAHFSKRREAILKELGERGLESASAAAFAALGTREPKTIIPPRNELFDRWKEEGRCFGFQPENLLSKCKPLVLNGVAGKVRKALAEAVAEITAQQNYFTQNELTRRTLEISQEFGIPAKCVVQGVASELALNPLFVSLGTRDAQSAWTTQEVLDLEEVFRRSIQELRIRPVVGASDATCEAVLSKPRGKGRDKFLLDNEQQEAVRYIAQGKESIKVISGFAGAGKTDMLAAAKEALEQHGYRVIGTSLAGVAARNLQESAGIESESIRMRQMQLYPDASNVLKHHAKQLWRAAQGKETYSLPNLSFDEKTVLVVDEAGMVGVRDFAMLAKTVVEQGGSLIAVGDERQLSAIERPGAFDFLVKEVPGVRLMEIRRQRDPADMQAVKDVVFGNPEAALEHYAQKGQFFVGSRRSDAEQELVADWKNNGGAEKPTDHRIFAATRAEVDRLNKHCQWERIQAGVVDASDRVEHDGRFFMTGDRVRFDLSARSLGIQKGERGTVVATKDGLTGKFAAIALDSEKTNLKERLVAATKHHAQQLLNEILGKRTEKVTRRENIVVIPLETLNPLSQAYQGLSHDYAMTTHLGQGQTVRQSYVLLGGVMTSRELAYVQSSRHRERLFLYASEEDAGKPLTELARSARPTAATGSERQCEISSYSPLVSQMKLSQARELASLRQERNPIPNEENSDVDKQHPHALGR